jgi:hypothetical protein
VYFYKIKLTCPKIFLEKKLFNFELIIPYFCRSLYIKTQFQKFFPCPYLFLSFPSPSISLSSILSPFRLHSVFSLFLSLSLSHFATSIPHVLNFLSLLIAHSGPSFLSFRPIPALSLHLPTSKSGQNFSLSYTFSPQVLRNFLCHTPLILPVVSGFFDSFPSFLLVYMFVPFTQLYIHPFSFPRMYTLSIVLLPFLNPA